MKIARKVVIITGAGRGIGKSVALEFAGAGYVTMLIARSKKELRETARLINKKGRALVAPLNVADREQVKQGLTYLKKKCRQIDVLINAAGIQGPIGSFEKNKIDEWRKTIEVNLMGSVYCMKEIIPQMINQKYGVIINFSGGGALTPRENFSAYATSKAALVRLTETIAVEVKKYGLRVNAISPGGVNTVMFKQMFAVGENRVGKKEWDKLTKQEKTGGISPKMAAKLCLWLSSENSVLTGKTISAPYDNWSKWDKKTLRKTNESDWLTMRRLDPYTLDKLVKIKI